MVCARCLGSSASAASGRPCATSQNGQRRVQMSPRIMKVAVPLPKHSPMFGHDASSQTVCSFCSRRMRLMSWKRESAAGARTRIHGGFASACACGTILIVLRAPFSFTPASRMLEQPQEGRNEIFGAFAHAKALQVGDREPRIAARVDRREGREVHVDVQRKAVV